MGRIPTMTGRVKDIDRGWKRIVREVKKNRDGTAALVGIQGSEAEVSHGDYGTNVEIGAVHEFGTRDGKIPSRPFLRQPFDANLSKYHAIYKNLYGRFLAGADVRGELLMLGEAYRQDVIEAVKNDDYKEWAPSTRKRKEAQGKGGDVPLWDTSQLLNSITTMVRKMSEVSK